MKYCPPLLSESDGPRHLRFGVLLALLLDGGFEFGDPFRGLMRLWYPYSASLAEQLPKSKLEEAVLPALRYWHGYGPIPV